MTDDLTPESGEAYYVSVLQWIHQTATMHWLGDAFDPEHMRNLANLAAAAIRGEPIADHEEAMAQARERAEEMFASFNEEAQ